MAFDEHRDEPDFLDEQGGYEAAPQKKGWSTGAKVALVLGILFGVLLLACCGVGFWFMNSIRQSMTYDDAEITAIREGIVSSIDLPEGYQPQMGLDFTIPLINMGMQWAIFSPDDEPGGANLIMLMQMQIQADQEQMRTEMEKAIRESGQQEIIIESSDTRTLTIDGQEVDFQFAKGKTKDGGQEVRQVKGVLTGAHGAVVILAIIAEEDWNEDEIVQMLESIKK